MHRMRNLRVNVCSRFQNVTSEVDNAKADDTALNLLDAEIADTLGWFNIIGAGITPGDIVQKFRKA